MPISDIPSCNVFVLSVTCEPLCRMQQNIDSSAKGVPVDSESPKADKPPNPPAEKDTQDHLKMDEPPSTQPNKLMTESLRPTSPPKC
jgi:cell division septation protein DedD